MTEVDLDALAAGYRYRPATEAARARPGRAVAGLGPDRLVLDVGGGPGDHAAEFTAAGHSVVVVDPTMTMLKRAQRRAPVVAGRGEALPVAGGRADVVYSHLAIHYFQPASFLSEAYRVLRPGGRLWIWTMGRTHFETSFTTRFFPDVARIDTARFPDPAGLAAAAGGHGFRPVSHEIEIERKRMTARQWRQAMVAGFISSWQLLGDDARAEGLAVFDAAYPGGDEIVEYTLRFDVIIAERPTAGAPSLP